ncbi:MAG: type I methionyl aminopeptidase, partial [Chitinophagales bacterium]|nr:type I methionyl aminopeptidase [Chitinophagales bacterium]
KVAIDGKTIDKEAETFIRDHNGIPGFKGYHGFPATLCLSINEAVVHGIPNDKPLGSKDIISVDCGVLLNGYFGDSAFTFGFNEVDEEVRKLMRVTRTSLMMGIEEAKAGNRVGDISYAVQNYCEREHQYGVVRELVGHGLGKNLHEEPEIPNFGQRGRGPVLKEGLVICIEPMINLGAKGVRQLNDGWTILTKDGKPSAHYEHCVAIRKEGPDILSNHDIIDEAIKNNPEIIDISINF